MTKKNKILDLAIQATDLPEDMQSPLLDLLDTEITNSLKTSESINDIYDALKSCVEINNEKAFNLIDEETSFCVEEILFENKETLFESTFILMPCLMESKINPVELPTIQTINNTINEYVKDNLSLNPDFKIHVCTFRTTKESVEDLTYYDFFELHKNSINGFLEMSDEEKTERNNTNPIQLDSQLDILYFGILVIRPENSETFEADFTNFTDLQNPLWNHINESLSNENLSLTFIAPQSIYPAIDEAEHFFQELEFDLFWKNSIKNRDVELVYSFIEEEDDAAILMVIEAEDRTLTDFYVYQMENQVDFLQTVIEKSIQYNKTLWRNEKSISREQLIEWSNEEDSIDFNNIVKTSDLVDLDAAYNALVGYSFNNKKPTIH